MGKKRLILLLFLNLLFGINCVDKKTSFYHELSLHQTFQKDRYSNYYNAYLKTHNILFSLNLVNHPDFLSETNLNKALNIESPLTLVNKQFYLDNNFIPDNLIPININQIKRENEQMLIKKEVLAAATKMFNDATIEGLNLIIYSGYRSFAKQQSIYNNSSDVSYVAKPGFSEHQTGYALDIATLDSGLSIHFTNTKEYQFLISNSYKYGFILRYPKDAQDITQYPFEPWHFRFVGTNAAETIYQKKLTLEEYIYMYTEVNMHQ